MIRIHCGLRSHSGRLLQDMLDSMSDAQAHLQHPWVVNWGRRSDPDYPFLLNKNIEYNKYDELELLKEAGLPTVPFDKTGDTLGFPRFQRSIHHSQGKDIHVIWNSEHSLYETEGKEPWMYEDVFYTQYIFSDSEYRVHVVGQNTYSCRKTPKPGGMTKFPVRSLRNGWAHVYAPDTPQKVKDLSIKAVYKLGLDFGAVDILRCDDTDYYILEVNTAPGLKRRKRIEWYAQQIIQMCLDKESHGEIS